MSTKFTFDEICESQNFDHDEEFILASNADRYEKEIEKLKEEIDLFTEALSREAEITDHLHSEIEKRDQLLEQAKWWIEKYPNAFGPDEGEQWIKQVEELKGGK